MQEKQGDGHKSDESFVSHDENYCLEDHLNEIAMPSYPADRVPRRCMFFLDYFYHNHQGSGVFHDIMLRYQFRKNVPSKSIKVLNQPFVYQAKIIPIDTFKHVRFIFNFIRFLR